MATAAVAIRLASTPTGEVAVRAYGGAVWFAPLFFPGP